jgi:hypothetical protein
MAEIRQNLETTRCELGEKLQAIARNLMLAGLSPDQIKKEMHAAVERVVWSPQTAAIQGSSGGHSEGEAARRAETKKTLDDYGKKVGS